MLFSYRSNAKDRELKKDRSDCLNTKLSRETIIFFARSYHTILIKPSLFWIVDIYHNFDIASYFIIESVRSLTTIFKIMTKLGFDESEWIRILNNGFKSSYTVLIVNLLSLDLINLEIGIMIYHVTTWSSPCRISYR